MTIITISRAATPEEVTAEMDRRGAVIEKFETNLRHAASGMFVDHSCWKCLDGKKSCIAGNPRQCEYPHARND